MRTPDRSVHRDADGSAATPTLVFLHGPAGVGKLTVARAIAERVHYPVFHNHLVVDLLTDIFPFGTEPFVLLRERMWLDVFTEAVRARRSLLFTFAPEPTVRPGFAERVRTAVEEAGGRVGFVRLLVGRREQERRVALPTRREFHKLGDPALLAVDDGRPPAEQPPADLSVDTEQLEPVQAADMIIAGLALQSERRLARYP